MMRYQLTVRVLAALIAAVFLSCTGNKEMAQTVQVSAVKVQVVQPSDQAVSHTYTGSVEGEQQAVIRAKLSETVQKVHVHEGQVVKEDDLLISLDKTGPSSQYNQTLSLYQNARKNFEKMEFLYKQGAISETQFDGAKTDYEVKKASFDAVSRLVDITSPIVGTVTSVPVSEGSQVMLGQVLATVATTRRLRVKLAVNPEDVATFAAGAEVTISSEVFADTLVGRITAVATSADPATRTFQIEAIADNERGIFKPGMFVRAAAIKSRLNGVIVAPTDAIVLLDGKPNVFVVQGGVAHRRPVSIGTDLDGHIVITSGLAAGDSLVTLGQTYLDDGFAVNVVQTEEAQR
jgi:membrane fusion protein (multidrug efflux system)